ncbi:hypothetical protein SSX86_031842 [Deinandra increscens subsp. villosa]|uniref:F-box associated beta-propeller type 3 domain-containing protein n=1 Tax=Deinandra increscens subsp. villosa TaxID=3103831 RepID=A0AAP0C4Z8_9ASTR
MSNDVCEEMFVEIFSRLPSKSLLRFRSLSKWSYACIGGPDFIRLHALRTQNKLLMLVHNTPPKNGRHQKKSNVYTLHSEDRLPYNRSIYKTRVHYPFNDCEIVGSCNGILCVYERRNGDISLWNPSIRRKLTIRDHVHRYHHRHHRQKFGFGYDPITDDYKILKLSKPTPFLYTMKTHTWRKIASPPIYPYYRVDSYQCLFDGALYFAVTVDSDRCYDSYIMRFDLSSEAFTILESPQPSVSWQTGVVTVIDGCLAVISGKDEVAWIWVRSKEEDQECTSSSSSWYVAFVLKASDYGGGNTRRVFQLTAIDGLLLDRGFNSNIVIIDPETHVKSRLVGLSYSSYIDGVSMFTESLGLLGMGTSC